MNESDCHIRLLALENGSKPWHQEGYLLEGKKVSRNRDLDRTTILKQSMRFFIPLAGLIPASETLQIFMYLIRRRSHPSGRNDL
jgi:hypothetical protein